MQSVGIRRGIPQNFRAIVCLCGPAKNQEAFRVASASEAQAGRIVLSITPSLPGIFMEREQLMQLHFDRIWLADEILIVNPGGYIGESTRQEIEYARQLGKLVRWLYPPIEKKGTPE